MGDERSVPTKTQGPLRFRVVVIVAALGAAPIMGGVLYLQDEEGCSDCLANTASAVAPVAESSEAEDWSRLSASHLDGSPFRMSDLVGKPVILDFWATWCPPCRKQREILHKLAREYDGRVRIVALSVDEDAAALKKYIAKHARVTHELLASHGLLHHFGVEALPTLVVIDANGRTQHVASGLAQADELRRIVAPLLQ